MKAKSGIPGILLMVLPDQSGPAFYNGPVSYIIGGIIAVLILGYLIYTLLRPDKF